MDFAAFSAALMARSHSGERYTSLTLPTFGSAAMAVSSSERTALPSTFILPSRDGISPPS